MLELKASRLAAERRTDEDLECMENALIAYKNKVLKGEDAVQEDLLFHLAIAKASKNATLNTIMLMITPEIITNFEKYHVCNENKAFTGIQEHSDIFEAIKNQQPDVVREKVKIHFKALYEYCYSF